MDRDACSPRMSGRSLDTLPRARHASGRHTARATIVAAAIATIVGCAAHTGRLTYVPEAVTPPSADSLTKVARAVSRNPAAAPEPLRALFADTTVGFVMGTGDSTRRYLGRLRDGYTFDTLNVILLGDNRP